MTNVIEEGNNEQELKKERKQSNFESINLNDQEQDEEEDEEEKQDKVELSDPESDDILEVKRVNTNFNDNESNYSDVQIKRVRGSD